LLSSYADFIPSQFTFLTLCLCFPFIISLTTHRITRQARRMVYSKPDNNKTLSTSPCCCYPQSRTLPRGPTHYSCPPHHPPTLVLKIEEVPQGLHPQPLLHHTEIPLDTPQLHHCVKCQCKTADIGRGSLGQLVTTVPSVGSLRVIWTRKLSCLSEMEVVPPERICRWKAVCLIEHGPGMTTVWVVRGAATRSDDVSGFWIPVQFFNHFSLLTLALDYIFSRTRTSFPFVIFLC
jgi:hypothetical protein